MAPYQRGSARLSNVASAIGGGPTPHWVSQRRKQRRQNVFPVACLVVAAMCFSLSFLAAFITSQYYGYGPKTYRRSVVDVDAAVAELLETRLRQQVHRIRENGRQLESSKNVTRAEEPAVKQHIDIGLEAPAGGSVPAQNSTNATTLNQQQDPDGRLKRHQEQLSSVQSIRDRLSELQRKRNELLSSPNLDAGPVASPVRNDEHQQHATSQGSNSSASLAAVEEVQPPQMKDNAYATGEENLDHPRPPLRHFKTMPKYSNATAHSPQTSVIPFVIMAFQRVDYLMQLVDSLRASDFPKHRVSLVVSHDGHVPAMVDYVESLKSEFRIVQLFHPHSCYEHPTTFPGNDTTLNVGYKGDIYGNQRSPWATCCKHHFTWMLNQVFRLTELQDADTFFFLEEDYIVGKTIYSSICTGLDMMAVTESRTTNGYFGLVADTTESQKSFRARNIPSSTGDFVWQVEFFQTGPMTLNRNLFALMQNHSTEYCTRYDEYNWDWTMNVSCCSLVWDTLCSNHSTEYCTRYDEYNWDWTMNKMMFDQYLPYTVLVPYQIPLVHHIGLTGMHTSEHVTRRDFRKRNLVKTGNDALHFRDFLGLQWTASRKFRGEFAHAPPKYHKLSGGWNHPRDQQHCQDLFASPSG